MQQRKIIYLINPISGTSEKQAVLRTIRSRTQAKGIPYEIGYTNAAGDYSELKRKISSEEITDVVICGGDGSVSAVTGALLNTNIRIGIIPLGSGNGLALAAKIPVSASKALEIIFHGYASPVDGFYINGKFSCMLCGIGFDAQVAHDFSVARTRGLQTYIKLSAINYFKAKPFSFTVQNKENSFKTAAFFISIANGNQFGNNFIIAPQASLYDGLLDIVVVNNMNKLMLPFSILGQLTGINTLHDITDHIEKRNIIYFQADSLVIKNHDLAPVHIDGEPQESAAELIINIRPKAFLLMQPEPVKAESFF